MANLCQKKRPDPFSDKCFWVWKKCRNIIWFIEILNPKILSFTKESIRLRITDLFKSANQDRKWISWEELLGIWILKLSWINNILINVMCGLWVSFITKCFSVISPGEEIRMSKESQIWEEMGSSFPGNTLWLKRLKIFWKGHCKLMNIEECHGLRSSNTLFSPKEMSKRLIDTTLMFNWQKLTLNSSNRWENIW